MKALDVYKPPFKIYGGCKIYYSGGGMALDFTAKMSDETQQRIVDILNGNSKEFSSKDITYDEGNIFADGKKFLRVRGWGHLTGIGGLNLSYEEAILIQDEFGNWVVNRLMGKV